MAKAKPIESLACSADAAEMAVIVLRSRFDEMLDFRDEALLPGSLDGVHDMRVASRRFRSALRDFAPLFKKKHFKPLKKGVKGVAAALGNVRDHDVEIEALTELAAAIPTGMTATGIENLIANRRETRIADHHTLITEIDPDAVSKLGNLLTHLTAESTGDRFRDSGRNLLNKLLDEFLARTDAIYEPLNTNELHTLRIAAKRLRYALQLFNICWNGDLRPYAKKLSKLQSSLGDLHDCDVWIEHLNRELGNGFLDRATAEWLIAEFLSRRNEKYTSAVKHWSDWTASDLTAELRALLEK